MINVLIVDDNRTRVDVVVGEISKAGLSPFVNLVVCESADEARLELSAKFDLLILDVVLPKKVDSTPHPTNSMALLNDICGAKKKFIRPTLIIGLTANVEELDNYKAEFLRSVTVVLDGSLYSSDWKYSIMGSINSLLDSQLKVIQKETDKLLITVHGIRTYGKWQQELKENLNKYSRDFNSVDFKYGFFDIFSFSLPYLRNRKAISIARRIASVLDSSADKDIYIVAHSYGTYILSKALELCGSEVKICSVILCGSPLKHSHDIEHIIQRSEITINECGTRDGILVLARCFLLGLGDAGRVGFTREHTSSFMNRWHKGGHSHYFDDKGTPNFYQRFWLPLMATGEKPISHDDREPYLTEDVVDIGIKFLTVLKPILYGFGFYFLVKFFVGVVVG
ncbi:response regulator [Pseudomonas glycinae]|uniref:response regulator n=1 Tax=Pseudomonas glycinae TaxID=1785145 RepID=UPI001F3EC153|nr:response regulator [Pseudomonas glycinae]